nr:MAG TPA: hypothetical protein [Caudoviricetes sp.]
MSCGELKPLVGEICASDAIYYILQIRTFIRGNNGR